MSDEQKGTEETSGIDLLNELFNEEVAEQVEIQDEAPEEEVVADEAPADEPVVDETPDAGDDIVTDEVAPEPEAEPVAEVPAPDAALEAKWDKRMQQVDQLTSTLQRQVEAATNAPTEENLKKAEATQSRLDTILESKEEVDPYAAVPQLAQAGKDHENRLAEMQAQIDSMAKASADSVNASQAQIAEMQSNAARTRFALDFPDLADRYDDLGKQATEQVNAYLGEAVKSIDPNQLMQIDGRAFMDIVKAEQAKMKATDTPKESVDATPVKKPVATNPLKSKSGKAHNASLTHEQKMAAALKGLVAHD